MTVLYPTIFEGEFNSYSAKWNVSLTDTEQAGEVFWSVEQGYLLFRVDTEVWLLNISDGSTEASETPLAAYVYGQRCHSSILGKYLVYVDADDTTQILVIKSNAVLQTIQAEALKAVYTVSISPCGKYIAIAVAGDKLYLYEGS